MKNYLIAFTAAALISTAPAMAQKARLVGGLNLANVSVTDNGRVDDANMLTSFQLGVVGDFDLGGILFLQPGVLFTGKGTKSESGDPSSATYFKSTSNPRYIEIPVNLVFKTPQVKNTRFFVGAGPYLGIGVSGKNEVEGKYLGVGFKTDEDIEFSDDDPTTLSYEEGAGFGIMKRIDYGVNGLAGIEGKSMVLSVNYGLGLAKLQSGGNSSEDNNNKHRVLSFTLGFKL
jgi:hypothetical protein